MKIEGAFFWEKVMPCKNPTAKMIVKISNEDIFLGYEYRKITCAKAIGETGYEKYCRRKLLDAIIKIEFDDAAKIIGIDNVEERFYLYLEWEALLAALCQYKGIASPIDDARYEIVGVEHSPEFIAVIQLTIPPEEIPKIIPCCKIPK